jgi:hypothetical protein
MNGDNCECYDNDVFWGQLVKGRSRSDEQADDWFLPPRPFKPAQWELLWGSWASAMNAVSSRDLSDCVTHLARFHWYFVHLHPFACANQSLAFALVNCLLNRIAGSGIPQLVLDHWALRMDCKAYTRLFCRAVTHWITSESGSLTRHRDRMQKRQVLDGFLVRLDEPKAQTELDSVSSGDPQGAQLALLSDG